MMRFLILLGYFELTMYLQLTGKLNQYINLHYAYLAYLSMVLSFILAIVQLVVWMRRLSTHSHLTKLSAKVASVAMLSVPLFIGWVFPTVTLDATTVSAKGYNFPTASEVDAGTMAQEGTSQQYLKPDTSSYFTKAAYTAEMQKAFKKYANLETIEIGTENYMEVMELIYDYPDQFLGKTVTYTGFVYNDPDDAQAQFLFRFGVIHCIADSGVYGLLTTGNAVHYADNTWVRATGTVATSYHQNLGQSLPCLEIISSEPVNEPDNPYVYRVF